MATHSGFGRNSRRAHCGHNNYPLPPMRTHEKKNTSTKGCTACVTVTGLFCESQKSPSMLARANSVATHSFSHRSYTHGYSMAIKRQRLIKYTTSASRFSLLSLYSLFCFIVSEHIDKFIHFWFFSNRVPFALSNFKYFCNVSCLLITNYLVNFIINFFLVMSTFLTKRF